MPVLGRSTAERIILEGLLDRPPAIRGRTMPALPLISADLPDFEKRVQKPLPVGENPRDTALLRAFLPGSRPDRAKWNGMEDRAQGKEGT